MEKLLDSFSYHTLLIERMCKKIQINVKYNDVIV